MKKALKVAIAASILTVPALADSPYTMGTIRNMENPLFLPSEGEIYSKIGFGVMYKITDSNDAQKKLFHGGEEEFPIWRPTLDLGYGITDRWAVHGQIGYTHNRDIHRYGFHLGRIGTTYRILSEDLIWDIYGDFHLGGIEKMKGALVIGADSQPTFQYDNFSNGRWGYHIGTKVGKVWDRWTTSAFVELLRTWGNHNNEIDVTMIPTFTTVDKISVDLKSTNETTVGINAFYQADDRWSFGGGFRFVEHSDNGVKSVHTKLNTPAELMTAKMLLDKTHDMDDGWHEYIVSGVLANQITDAFQLALVGEYTFDFSHPNSQNGTDVKVELGVRANVRF